ncbi:pirin family protein [Alteromonas halophila]|uniref:Quercetin 2,3-dioxygenase n=1 Tax=Alteromonas halophila TaxID=516698 RepID=A0A918N085_9ALTE|nr:pirin family protein [Alteromonas halophila]GGW88763.1 quercetin 2,3-dioxygenase [Alteromonas halophila]
MYIRRAKERGSVDMGWLQSKHSFSFGHYYDEQHMGFSVLRVINDDIVSPGRGFGTHGHRDMEIISYVISGSLKHKDSTGNDYEIPAGDIQRMSAGKGILHSEFNPSEDEPVNFLQIWIIPDKTGITPEYEQKTITGNGELTPLVSPDGRSNTLRIHQDAYLYRVSLAKDNCLPLKSHDRFGYLHVVRGSLSLTGSGTDLVLGAGDAIGVEQATSLDLTATEDTEAIWFDLPVVNA